MIEIKIKDDSFESFDKALKKFKRLVNNDGFLKELQDRKYFVSQSEKKRLKKRQAKRRNEDGRV